MKRVLAVLLVAAMTAAFAGVDEPRHAPQAAAPQQTPDDAYRVAAAKRIGSTVKVKLVNGREVKGRLVEISRDSITIESSDKKRFPVRQIPPVRQIIPFDEIKKVEGTGHKKLYIALGVVGGLVGACTIAFLNADV
jgi:RimP C-terminal SH3 domain